MQVWHGYLAYLFDAETQFLVMRGGSSTGASFNKVLSDPWLRETEMPALMPPVGERFLDQVNRISYDFADLLGAWSERASAR